MNKYDDYINQLKNEIDNLNLPDLKTTIKANYQSQSKPNFKKNSFWKLAYSLILLMMVIISANFIFSNKNSEKPNINSKPYIPTTVSDTYAFELMNATNIIFSFKINELSLLDNQYNKNTIDLDKVSKQIHLQYLSIRNILFTNKMEYTIAQRNIEGYTDEMTISIKYDNYDLQSKAYFNKKLIEIDDDEEIYDLEGIMTINGKTYKLEGQTEIEEDEIKTKIKVELSENSYLMIEQEKEDDEQEFVQSIYESNKKIQENRISIEEEDGRTIIKVDEKGQENIKMNIELFSNIVLANINSDIYKGKVEISETNTTINYYFVKEKQQISIELDNKKIFSTNKNAPFYVY